MKKTLFATLFGTIACCAAMASDGGVYTEVETRNNSVRFNYDAETYYVAAPERPVARRAIVAQRPCGCAPKVVAADPVTVKTHTEVIDHYQVYQPVVKYVPAGTYSERRVIETPRCNRCNG